MQEEKRRYKVNVGDVYMIFRSDNSGYVNYKLSIKNKFTYNNSTNFLNSLINKSLTLE